MKNLQKGSGKLSDSFGNLVDKFGTHVSENKKLKQLFDSTLDKAVGKLESRINTF